MLRRVGQRPGIGDRSEGTWRRSRRSIGWEAVIRALILLGIPGLVIGMGSAAAQTDSQEDAMLAAIHPVGDAKAMQAWPTRVPVTREYPADSTTKPRGHGSAFVLVLANTPERGH